MWRLVIFVQSFVTRLVRIDQFQSFFRAFTQYLMPISYWYCWFLEGASGCELQGTPRELSIHCISYKRQVQASHNWWGRNSLSCSWSTIRWKLVGVVGIKVHITSYAHVLFTILLLGKINLLPSPSSVFSSATLIYRKVIDATPLIFVGTSSLQMLAFLDSSFCSFYPYKVPWFWWVAASSSVNSNISLHPPLFLFTSMFLFLPSAHFKCGHVHKSPFSLRTHPLSSSESYLESSHCTA